MGRKRHSREREYTQAPRKHSGKAIAPARPMLDITPLLVFHMLVDDLRRDNKAEDDPPKRPPLG
jgi:hypothetical protein